MPNKSNCPQPDVAEAMLAADNLIAGVCRDLLERVDILVEDVAAAQHETETRGVADQLEPVLLGEGSHAVEDAGSHLLRSGEDEDGSALRAGGCFGVLRAAVHTDRVKAADGDGVLADRRHREGDGALGHGVAFRSEVHIAVYLRIKLWYVQQT